jgi:hypothetical protein
MQPVMPTAGGGRWYSLSASLWAYSGAGIDQYAIYSPLLKSKLGITQGQLETIGTAGAFVNLLGLSTIPGLLGDAHGPRVVLCGAVALQGSGLWLFWATLSGLVPCGGPSVIVYQLAACKMLSGWGSEWPSAGLLPLTMRNFPDAPTMALACFKCMVALSGAVVSVVYSGFLAPDAERFLLFIAVASPSLMLLALPLVQLHPAQGDHCPAVGRPAYASSTATRRRLGVSYALIILLMVCITSVALLDDPVLRWGTISLARQRGAAVAVVLVWLMMVASPVLAPCAGPEAELQRTKPTTRSGAAAHGDGYSARTRGALNQSLIDSVQVRKGTGRREDAVSSSVLTHGGEGEELAATIRQALPTLNNHLLMITVVVLVGCVGQVNTNLAQILEAAAPTYYKQDLVIAIAFYSVASTSARLMTPLIMDRLVKWQLPSSAVFILMAAIACFAQLMLSWATRFTVFIGIIFTGVVAGLFFTAYPVVLSDMYGTRFLGAHYKLANVPDSLGQILFGKFVSQYFYERAITHYGQSGEGSAVQTDGDSSSLPVVAGSASGSGVAAARSKTCIGPLCFRGTHLTLAMLCVLTIAANVVLAYRVHKRHERALPSGWLRARQQ